MQSTDRSRARMDLPSSGAPGGARAESYESMRTSRARAWLLAVSAWPVTGLALVALVLVWSDRSYVPPVVLTVDAKNRVVKSEVGTPEVLRAQESLVQSEIARYLTERFTLDRAFRDEHIRYVDLHSADEVATAFDKEMDANNKANPYYQLPVNVVRRVKDLRIRLTDTDEQKGEATLTTVVDGGPATYWFVRFRYDFVKQALAPENRYINGTGFVMTAFEKTTEPGPR